MTDQAQNMLMAATALCDGTDEEPVIDGHPMTIRNWVTETLREFFWNEDQQKREMRE